MNGSGQGEFFLPKRRLDTHKGDYGRLLIIGGSVGYTGAPTLCARAAVRSGAGLVYLGVPADIAAEVVAALENVEGLDVPALLNALGRLAVGATGNAQRMRQLETQLLHERERSKVLMKCFSELLRVNTEFLQAPMKSRAAKLSDYLRDLESSVRPCAMLLLDEIG